MRNDSAPPSGLVTATEQVVLDMDDTVRRHPALQIRLGFACGTTHSGVQPTGFAGTGGQTSVVVSEPLVQSRFHEQVAKGLQQAVPGLREGLLWRLVRKAPEISERGTGVWFRLQSQTVQSCWTQGDLVHHIGRICLCMRFEVHGAETGKKGKKGKWING